MEMMQQCKIMKFKIKNGHTVAVVRASPKQTDYGQKTVHFPLI